MALRFKALALAAPTDCRISMNFQFPKNYPIKEFLQKINIPHLFHAAENWQQAHFKFFTHGIDHENYFMAHEIDIHVGLIYYILGDVTQKIHDEFQDTAKYFFGTDIEVSKMTISFFQKVYKL